MLRVFIALGKQLPKNKAMIEDTEEVARLLAKYNCTIVQGGAKTGLMGVVVEEFQKYSDEVVMIVPEVHKADLENTVSKEHYIVEGESDRMRITIHTCDMMVVLPGGSGTLAELAYYNETCKSGEHGAKVVIVNTKGFYNNLFKFHKHQIKNGFMTDDACRFEVISNAKQLEPILQQLITSKQSKLQQEEIAEAVVEEAKEVAEVKPAKSRNKKAPSKAKTENNVVKKEAKVAPKKEVKTETKKAEKPVANKSKETKKVAKVEVKPEVKVEASSKTKAAKKPAAAKKSVAKTTVKAEVKSEKSKVPVKQIAKVEKIAKGPVKKEPKAVKTKEETKPVAKAKTEVKVETKKAEKPVAKAKTEVKNTKKEVKTATKAKAEVKTAKEPVKKEVKAVKAKTTTKAEPVKVSAKKATAKKDTKAAVKPSASKAKTTTKKSK